MYVCVAYSDAHANEIQEFVAQGGGLLIGGHAWYWSHTHSDQEEMTDFPGMLMHHKISIITCTVYSMIMYNYATLIDNMHINTYQAQL